MSRFIIETYSISQQYSLRVVYFCHGYSNLWMKNSKGQPTIPYVVLKDMVLNSLEEKGQLSENFFENYQQELEKALYQKLIDIGKPDNARQRSKSRSRDIGSSLRAIIVEEERMIGRTQVHFLNKNPESPAVIYDEDSGIIKIDDKQWLAGSDLKESSGHSGNIIRTEGGSLKRWWRQNGFLICTSFIMLILVPGGMILGMLYVRDKAEQTIITPISDSIPAINDTLQIDSINVSK